MRLTNRVLIVVCACVLASCNNTGTRISDYMESTIESSCRDTTFWKIVDLQDVLGIDYDSLFIFGSAFGNDICNVTHSDWNGGDYLSDKKDLFLLIKGNKVVYKDEIDKSMEDFYAFDQPFRSTAPYILKDTSTIYYVRVDISNNEKHYFFYNKERKDKGEEYNHHWIWFR